MHVHVHVLVVHVHVHAHVHVLVTTWRTPSLSMTLQPLSLQSSRVCFAYGSAGVSSWLSRRSMRGSSTDPPEW